MRLDSWTYRSVQVGMIVALGTLAQPAAAFCGFYVAGADQKLFNEATQVAMMRHGTQTVLSMQNNYKGPPQDFAMVVPVPVVLHKEDVKLLPQSIFDRLDKLTAPRLVEYWEEDPCPKNSGHFGIGYGSIGTVGYGAGGSGSSHRTHVQVLGRFEIGEYEIVILGSDDSTALDGWLRKHNYKIPEGADKVLKPYVAAGMKFFVAKVNTKKVKFSKGMAQLSPLRFSYNSPNFSLPVRLGLLNSSGKQDLIVYIISPENRYEASNYTNVTIPTNVEVVNQVRYEFGSFYATLFDKTMAEHPKSIVTEYSWETSKCDPCPTPPLRSNELSSLGADALKIFKKSKQGHLVSVKLTSAIKSNKDREIIQKQIWQAQNTVVQCLEQIPTLAPMFSSMTATILVTPEGKITRVKLDSPTPAKPKELESCLQQAFLPLKFPKNIPMEEVHMRGSVSITNINQAQFARGYVVTRLHTRYSKDTLGEDLVFQAVSPIEGGRETYGKTLSTGATSSPTNQFQARYIIRHPWTGAITCQSPEHGIWGGPPSVPGVDLPPPKPPARSATGLAFVRRSLPLDNYISKSGLGAKGSSKDVLFTATVLNSKTIAKVAPVVPPPAASSSSPSPLPPPGASAPLPAPRVPEPLPSQPHGCASCSVGTSATSLLGASSLFALLAGFWLRTRGRKQ
jgi:hypothetical protein